jgi:hypothetical protein
LSGALSTLRVMAYAMLPLLLCSSLQQPQEKVFKLLLCAAGCCVLGGCSGWERLRSPRRTSLLCCGCAARSR